MKKVLFGLVLAAVALPLSAQQKPVYLDASKPIEERVEDALSRLTLEEKVKLTHAQSKFSSAGVPRLGIPDVWTDDGPHGIRVVGRVGTSRMHQRLLRGFPCPDLSGGNLEPRNVSPLRTEHR